MTNTMVLICKSTAKDACLLFYKTKLSLRWKHNAPSAPETIKVCTLIKNLINIYNLIYFLF